MLVLGAGCHDRPPTTGTTQVSAHAAAAPGPEQNRPAAAPAEPAAAAPSHDIRVQLDFARSFARAEGRVRHFPRLELFVTMAPDQRPDTDREDLTFSVRVDEPFRIGGTLRGALDHLRLAGHDCEATGDVSIQVPAALDVRRPVPSQLALRAVIGACEGLLGWRHPFAIDTVLPVELYALPDGNL